MPEPEAKMWQEALDRAGIKSMVNSLTGGAEPGYSLSDFSLWTRTEDAERAKEIVRGIVDED